MTTGKIDFNAEGLLGVDATITEEAEVGVPAEEELAEYINKMLLSLQDSMGSMQIGLRIMTQRVSGLEKWVAYLLEKDPVLGPRLKAQADKEEAAAKTLADGTQG